MAKVVTDVVRDDFDGTRSYLLHCERSSGQYLFDVLVDAGAEFGLEIAGFVRFSGWRIWLEPVSSRHLGGRGLGFETVTTQIGARDRAHPDLIGGARG